MVAPPLLKSRRVAGIETAVLHPPRRCCLHRTARTADGLRRSALDCQPCAPYEEIAARAASIRAAVFLTHVSPEHEARLDLIFLLILTAAPLEETPGLRAEP